MVGLTTLRSLSGKIPHTSQPPKAGTNCHRLFGGPKLVSSVGTRLHRQYGIILCLLCVNKQIVKWLIPN